MDIMLIVLFCSTVIAHLLIFLATVLPYWNFYTSPSSIMMIMAFFLAILVSICVIFSLWVFLIIFKNIVLIFQNLHNVSFVPVVKDWLCHHFRDGFYNRCPSNRFICCSGYCISDWFWIWWYLGKKLWNFDT